MSLDKTFKDILIDRLDGWELVDFLQIPIEEVIELLEEQIVDNIVEVKDFVGLTGNESEITYNNEQE